MVRTLLLAGGVVCSYVMTACILIAGFPFWLVAALTTAIARTIEPAYAPWTSLVEFDATFGWRPRSHVNTHHVADDVFHITTDEHGWRGTATLSESDIVFFGDSFAFGYGIDDSHFFADLILSPRIKSIGCCGYNMVQTLMWMRHLAPHISGKLVVWSIYFGNDLYDNLTPDMCGYRTPFVRKVKGTHDWELVTSHISPAKWFVPTGLRRRDYAQKLADLCGPTFLSDRAYSACEFLIRQGKALCEREAARLAIMTIPDPLQLTPRGWQFLKKRSSSRSAAMDQDFPDRTIQTICWRLGVPFIASRTDESPRHRNRSDSHWNADGHRRIADMLTAFYRAHSDSPAHRPSGRRALAPQQIGRDDGQDDKEHSEMAIIDD